jgi:hypothetical protein
LKPIPCPLEIIYLNSSWLNADSLSRAAIANIVFAWWLGGCPDIDLNKDMDLQERAGLTNARWSRHRVYIKSSLTNIFNPLRKAYLKALDSQLRIAKRNESGKRALVEWHKQRKLNKLAGNKLFDDLSSRGVDVSLPRTLPQTHAMAAATKHKDSNIKRLVDK